MESLRNKGRAWVVACIKAVLAIPALIVAAGLIAAAMALTYTAGNIGIYTDTAAMLSEELPFRRSYEHYRDEFPQLVDMLLVVIDAPTPEAADSAARELSDHLHDAPELYDDIFLAGDDDFFARAALLYEDQASLDALARQLIAAQPLLRTLNQRPDLAAFALLVGEIATAPATTTGVNSRRLLMELDRSLAAALSEQPYDASWRRILSPDPQDGTARRYLFAKPVLDFTEPLAAEAAINHIRRATAALGQRYGATLRITGDAALSYEELTIALSGAQLSGLLALVMVISVLLFGLRSGWLAFACIFNLLTGLILTAAFATFAVGNLNLISLAFTVLYIGLGADFAIHLTLRYRERLIAGDGKGGAIQHAATVMAAPLWLCTLTTATGFFAFLPTSFSGVSELGLIAGTGMFINLLLSLTLLPALLKIVPAPQVQVCTAQLSTLHERTVNRGRLMIRSAAIAFALGAMVFLPRLEFDFDPLNLRPADAESVATLRDLMTSSDTPPFNITVLSDDRETARDLLEKLRKLPTVGEVRMIDDLLPVDNERKRATIQTIAATLASVPRQTALRTLPGPDVSTAALRELRTRLGEHDRPATELAKHIEQFLLHIRTLDAPARASRLSELESRWLGQLRPALAGLRLALNPPVITVNDLPADLRNRWISADGTWRIAVYPREDMSDLDALRRFVRSVQTVAPDATDEPVLSVEAGDAVVGAFRQAFTGSIIVIALLLVILVRRMSSVVLIMLPLLLAGILTMGVMGLFGIPFNFANVIALPLLFGIGVDNGVHIVQRATEPGGSVNPMRTSTSRAVLLSMLTTICGFGNLLISPHPGTASIGLVLTIGIAITLICTLVVLPAWLPKPRVT